MSFAILRTQKLTTKSKLRQASNHNLRKVDVLNADPEKKNYHLMGSRDPYALYEQKIADLGIKERANGVPAFEILTTFSPDSDLKIEDWARAQRKFFTDTYGADRILSMMVHMDETTPHCHTIVMPLVQKKGVWKLSCRDFLGGADKLIALQDKYAASMSRFGLERGIRGSKATHNTIKNYYGEMHKDIEEVAKELSNIPKPGMLNYKDTIKKLKALITTSMLQAARVFKLETQVERLKAVISDLKDFKKSILVAADGLKPDEIMVILTNAAEIKKEQKRVISDEVAATYSAVPDAPSVALKSPMSDDLTKKRTLPIIHTKKPVTSDLRLS